MGKRRLALNPSQHRPGGRVNEIFSADERLRRKRVSRRVRQPVNPLFTPRQSFDISVREFVRRPSAGQSRRINNLRDFLTAKNHPISCYVGLIFRPTAIYRPARTYVTCTPKDLRLQAAGWQVGRP